MLSGGYALKNSEFEKMGRPASWVSVKTMRRVCERSLGGLDAEINFVKPFLKLRFGLI